MEGEWPLQKWPVLRRENGQVTEVVSLIEGKWSCYRSGQLNGGSVVMLQRLLV